MADLKGKLISDKSSSGDKELDDAIEGLRSFGFSKKEILEAVSKIAERNLTAGEYISLALRNLNKK